MCSSLLITIFALGVAFGAGLTIVSLATPVWRKLNNDNAIVATTQAWQKVADSKTINTASTYYGIFTSCISTDTQNNQCYGEWKNAPEWKKASMACLLLSLAFCALAFVWSCVACCMCCCKSCLTPPLPLFAGLACALDIAGVATYGIKSGQPLEGDPTNVQFYKTFESQGEFGYSMWLGIGAIVVLFVDTLIGLVLVKTAKISPI